MLAQVVCLGLVLAAPESDPKLDAATQAKLREMQIERRDALKRLLRLRVLELKGGQGTIKDVMAEAQALLEAELALAKSPEEGVAARAVHLEVVKALEKMADSGVQAGVYQLRDFYLARAERLKAEIGWLKAGGKDTRKEIKGKPIKDYFGPLRDEERESFRRSTDRKRKDRKD